MLPDFFLLGAAKSGTTTLHDLLIQNSCVDAGRTKEPNILNCKYFDMDEITENYNKHFITSAAKKIRIDCSASYFHQGDRVISRLKKLYPEGQPKFIVIFRDPVMRAWSHYLNVQSMGWRDESFEEALCAEPERVIANDYETYVWARYFSDGLYGKQVKHWLENFDRKNFLFLKFDDLIEDTDSVINKLCRFLDIDKFEYKAKKSNQYSAYRYKFLNNITLGGWLKRIVGIFLSQNLRYKIGLNIQKLNKKKLIKPKLDGSLKHDLSEKYLQDLGLFEKLTGLSADKWLSRSITYKDDV